MTRPINLTYDICSSWDAKKVRTTRSTTATPAPSRIPFCRCFRGNVRTAAAITTALSPARIKSIRTMLMKAAKKSQLSEISPS